MKALRVMLLLLAIGIVGEIVVWSGAHYPVTNFPPRGTMVVVLGDSLSAGVGASKPDNGYVGILSARLNTPIVNKGVPGDTTVSGLARLDADVLAEHPDIVIVFLGGNDYLQRIPPDETFARLKEIIARIQGNGAVVLLVGIRGGVLKDNFSKRFKKLARESGSFFVPDPLGPMIGDPKLMSDEVHPNDAGYVKMADKIAPVLESIVASAPPASDR